MSQVYLEKIEDLDFHSSEAYKLLRTNIQFCGTDRKAICFTSCLPNEGKSNVSFHLAVALADINKKVIFIDCDLRKSVMVGKYKPDQPVLGLTHYLSGLNDLDEVLYETNVLNLDIIFSGLFPPNPAELLSGTAFKDLIDMLREIYDYVIIDTPPLGSVVDSAIVAGCCDGTILVVESKAISYKLAQKVIKQLEMGNCKVLGAVLNKVNKKQSNYSYYSKKNKDYR
jgi:capsular exopolysaccharide synthesis family protein